MGTRQYVTLIVALLLAGSLPATANIAGFTGNTDLFAVGAGGTVGGTNNFAVLTLAGDPLDVPLLAGAFVPGIGSGAFPVGAGLFYYIYQPTNDPPFGNLPLSAFSNSIGIAVPGVSLLAWGSFPSLIMTDAFAPIAPFGPDGLVLDGPGLDMDGPLGLGYTGLVPGPTFPPIVVTLGASSVFAIYDGVPLPPGATSDIIGFVSTLPPGWFTGGIIDGGVTSFGASPAPIPAPAAVLLGAVGLGLVGWLKRRLS